MTFRRSWRYDHEKENSNTGMPASSPATGLLFLTVILLRPALYVLGLLLCSTLSRLLDKREEDLRRRRDERGRGEGGGGWVWSLDAAARFVNGYLRYMAARTGRIPSHAIRMFIYRRAFLLRAEKKVVIHWGAELRSAYKISIGEGTIIGDEAKLDGRRGIRIGRNVNLSTGVWIWTLEHDPQSPLFSCDGKGGPVRIGDRAWLSAGVIVLPGVSVGEGAVVAAGSVVTEDLEPYTINAGLPAHKVGERNRELSYDFDGSHQPFM